MCQKRNGGRKSGYFGRGRGNLVLPWFWLPQLVAFSLIFSGLGFGLRENKGMGDGAARDDLFLYL